MANYAQIVDYAFLKPNGTLGQFKEALSVALSQRPRGFCVDPDVLGVIAADDRVKDAFATRLSELGVLRQFVVDFPHGRGGFAGKLLVAQHLVPWADEFDVVANPGALLDNDFERFKGEIRPLVELGKPVKVIIETGHYADNKELLERAAHWCADTGVFAIKTSTGFEPKVDNETKRGHVALWKKVIEKNNYGLQIKISGGQKTAQDVEAALEAGADIIGASTVEFE